MNEDYEQGYQDGQADLEQEFTDALKQAHNVSIRLENVAGHQMATATIYTPADSLLWAWLAHRFNQKATESVVDLGDQMLNSHNSTPKPTERDIKLAEALNLIDQKFGPTKRKTPAATSATA